MVLHKASSLKATRRGVATGYAGWAKTYPDFGPLEHNPIVNMLKKPSQDLNVISV
jgi:hypothetical protein